jgi:RHS repeat-associated protein
MCPVRTALATVNNYDPATNKINGASYDASGNLTSFTGSALTYDAENRITGASQGGIGSMYYLYDGAGRRVQEVSTYNVEKVFVYDVFGQMAAEYSLGAPSLPCTTCYIATDHLGSTRMVTDQNANVVGRHDYLPFGEEIAANTGGRNGLFGTQDFVNQKFTGQERDSETGLDFFQARYFSGALGRFASPDTPLLDQDPSNPQSWNLYNYVRNNPLSLIDPDGHTCVTATGEPVAPDYPDVKVDNNDGYGCQTVVTVYGGYIDPISVILSLSRLVLLPAQTNSQQETRPSEERYKRPEWLNNVTAVFGYDQQIPLPSCLVNVALKTAATDLNPFTPGVVDASKGALQVGSAAKYNQALRHAASRALTYPNKSSIFRGVMKTSGQLAKVADALLLVNVDYALADGLIAEWKSMKGGECQ